MGVPAGARESVSEELKSIRVVLLVASIANMVVLLGILAHANTEAVLTSLAAISALFIILFSLVIRLILRVFYKLACSDVAIMMAVKKYMSKQEEEGGDEK